MCARGARTARRARRRRFRASRARTLTGLALAPLSVARRPSLASLHRRVVPSRRPAVRARWLQTSAWARVGCANLASSSPKAKLPAVCPAPTITWASTVLMREPVLRRHAQKEPTRANLVCRARFNARPLSRVTTRLPDQRSQKHVQGAVSYAPGRQANRSGWQTRLTCRQCLWIPSSSRSSWI